MVIAFEGIYIILDYHCGSDESWSPVFFFKAALNSLNWSPSFAVYGDLGNENAQSLPRLQEETQKGMYDAILHVGDFAYDMDTVIITLYQNCYLRIITLLNCFLYFIFVNEFRITVVLEISL